MRWAQGTGDIGDGVTLAVTYGVVAEIGLVRKYDPLNPCDIGPGVPNVQPPALFPCAQAEQVPVPIRLAYFPMTMHQRLYQWPDTGVGPIRCFSEPSGWMVSYPPKEVPLGQADWPTRPIASIPVIRVDDETTPLMGEQPLDAEMVLPQRSGSLREFWTVYKTAPWANTALIRNLPFAGDTRKWFVSGVTKDGIADTPIGSCDVTVLRVDKMVVNPDPQANPVVGAVVSDPSTGAYSVQVYANVPHQVVAYVSGSPSKAGATLETVTPTDG